MRWLVFLICATVWAEIDMPRGLYRGTLEKVDGTAAQGRLIARAADGTVSSCAYDARTYMEADREKTSPLGLRVGDPIMIVADYRAGMRTCYARTLHVVPPPPPATRRATQQVTQKLPLMRLRGDRTISGRVIVVDQAGITVRTKEDGDVRLALRPDTAFLGEGTLSVNVYVSIRAGVDLKGILEAYQVSWAELLRTRQ